MNDVWAWFGSEGVRLLGDVVIPVAAILVPTVIALRIARRERLVSEEGERRSRRLQAGAEVLSALAPMVSADPTRVDMHGQLANLRGSIAVYRAWSEKGDMSGSWLALKHHEGMQLWGRALMRLTPTDSAEERADALDPPRRWVADMIDTFSGWLSGYVDDRALGFEAARLLDEQNERPRD